ncbi:MAG: CPCC family cysteine-rich protein [Pseudomonadota bacterium]
MDSNPICACPCCGHIVFEELQAWAICPICFWEDDPVQVADPWFAGGANKPSLVESQANYRKFGAMEQRFVRHVRPPREDDRKDQMWRLVGPEDKALATTPREIEEKRLRGEFVSYQYWLRSSSRQ